MAVTTVPGLIKRIITGFIRRTSAPRHTGADRRTTSRVNTPMRMDVCFLEGPQDDFGDGQVKDVSLKGIQFVSDAKPALGARMVLKLHFPRNFEPRGPLQIKAMVVRAIKVPRERLYHVACAFSNIEASSHTRLERFISWLRTDPKS